MTTPYAYVTHIKLSGPPIEEHIGCALEEIYPCIAYFKDENKPYRELSIYTNHHPAKEEIAKIKNHLTIDTNNIILSERTTLLPPIDWVAESQKSFPAMEVGPFYIHPSWNIIAKKTLEKPDMIPIQIDPGQAFGTGTHATTQGCLQLLAELATHYTPGQILDLGCGTAILAIACNKLWPDAPITACDIDPIAIKTGQYNARINNTPTITFLESEGYQAISTTWHYDLIIANILAEPLLNMAAQTSTYLHDRGYLLLSGILAEQKRTIIEKYHSHDITLITSSSHQQWPTLLLQKR